MLKGLTVTAILLTVQARAEWIESKNRFIVKSDNVSSLVDKIKSAKNGEYIRIENWGDSQFLSIEMPMPLDSSSVVSELKAIEQIEWIAPVRYFEGDPRESLVNDPKIGDQYHHKIIQSENAWKVATGSEEILVAVTDDGFDLNHEDLIDSIAINENEIPGNGVDDDNNGFIDDVRGWDFAENDNNPMSDNSDGAHGTHVAGIVAAAWNNGVGVTGMGPMLKVLPIKFYGGGRWSNEIVLKSYQYAVLRGAKIVNTSYNIDGLATDPVYLAAVDAVYNSGGIVFNSAGNSNAHQSARTKVEKIILVASTQSGSSSSNSKHDLKSSFSNYGKGVDIAAPGNPIFSLGRGNKYMDMSGTSMASPVAAAAMAYLWSVYPEKSREEIFALLSMGVDDIDRLNPKYEHKLGTGRINLAKSVEEKIRPLQIIDMVYDAKKRELLIQYWGRLDHKTRSLPTIKISGQNLSSMALTPLNRPELGTNELRYSLNVPAGEYAVAVEASDWKDVFGREFDGDLDGIPGGNWSRNIKL
ncbi:MAG: hypothetical protein Fur0010_09070 [Bdellovibrio sp.]